MLEWSLWQIANVSMVSTHLPIDQGEQDDAVEDVLGHFPVEEPVDWDLGLTDEPVTGRAAGNRKKPDHQCR